MKICVECDRAWWERMRALDEQRGPLERITWMDVNGDALRSEIAAFLEAAGVRPNVSTGIHDHLTYGYGGLDEWGFWEFPLRDGEYVG
jgi:hypothetical protein